jgi:hypothetical protein
MSKKIKSVPPTRHKTKLTSRDRTVIANARMRLPYSLPQEDAEVAAVTERRRNIKIIQRIRDSITDPSWDSIEQMLEEIAAGRK